MTAVCTFTQNCILSIVHIEHFSKMSKITICLVLLAFSYSIQGLPLPNEDIIAAAAAGNWNQVQNLLNSKFGADGWAPISAGNVRNLKPLEGGHVYGESEYSFQSSSNINGQTSKSSAGHKIINKDGEISEFDFEP